MLKEFVGSQQAAAKANTLLGHVAESITEREACYIAILDSIPDSVFSVDRDYRILTANKYGRERTFELTGFDLKPGDSMLINGKNQPIIDNWILAIQRAMKGEAFKIETAVEADGRTIYREASFTPIWHDGEILGVSCYAKDISDNRLTKEKLKDQELLFRSLLENSHDGIAMLSAGGRLKYISPSVGRILGFTFEEMLGLGMVDMVHPDDLESVILFNEELVPRYGKSAQIDYRMKSKTDGWRLINCHYTNMLHEPSIKALVVNYEDITDRRELEIDLENTVHNLIKADERQSSIINSLRANIALLDQDGIIIELNEAWKQFATDNQLVSSSYCIGDNYLEIAEKAACEGELTGIEVSNGIRGVLAGEIEEFSLEYTSHSDTEKRWFKVIVYPLYQKSRGGVVVYHVDVTDRKLAELQMDFDRRNQDALINSTSDLIWSFDADMRLITANESFLAMVKIVGDVDMKPGDYMIPSQGFSIEDQVYWTTNYRRVLSGEYFTDTVTRNIPYEFWTEVSFNPIWENGKVIGAACYSSDITVRKKAERLILKSQQMMADAESIAHFGSWELDLDNLDNMPENSLRWSDEVSRIFGYEPGEYQVTNENFFKAVHPDDREPIRQAVQKAIAENANYALYHRVLRPDGEVRWVQEEAKIVMNVITGKPIKMIGTVLDITERKASEEKLKEAEGNYREIFDKASDGIFVHEMETGKVIDVNLKACEITGATKEQILGGNQSEFLTGVKGYGSEDAADYIYKAINEGSQLFEWYSRRMDGTCYWNEVSLTRATIAGTERILAFFRNIDDRKLAEEKLQNSEKQFRQIVETAMEGIWMVDGLGNTVYANNKMCEILGYGMEELLQLNKSEIVAPAFREFAKESMRKRQLGENEHTDIKFIKKSGDFVWVNLSASAVMNDDCSYGGALAMVTDITNRKLAEESVRLSNERYELVTKATKDAIWDWNLLTDEIYWSEGYKNLFGYSMDGNNITIGISTRHIHPDDIERVLASVKNAIDDPATLVWQNEYRFIKSDGSIAHVNDRGHIIYSDNGTPIRMVGAMQDITAQKQAEESLRLSNERYELATNATNDAIWDWNILTGELYWTDGYETLFGYSREKEGLNFETCTSRIHLDDAKWVKASLQKEMDDPSSNFWYGEYRYTKVDDTYANVCNQGYIIRNEDGTPVRMVGAMQDITSRKLAEESHIKSEANLRTIFDHADRAYVLLDKNFRILSFNTVATEWAKLVYNAEFQEGESIITYLDEDKKEEGKLILESVLEGNHLDHDAQYRSPDGIEKWFSVRRYPVRNEDGSIIGICIATKEVTQRRQFQMERDKLTAEIVQRNKDLEQYAYIVSHNLRAPVANIIGFSDALLHAGLNADEKLDMLNGLDISIKRLDNVILDLNSILQVKKEVEAPRESVSFSTLVNDIALSIGNAIEKERTVIMTDFAQVDEIFTQKNYLYSIFYNLISNSIKYRQPDIPPVIEIKSRRFDGKIELSFSDNGLGIDLAKKNGQVFGLYKRFHPQVADGKGMGLFMVKTQVENLGGSITIDSEVNVGTEFKILFDCK